MQDGNTPLHIAGKEGMADCVELLLKGGASPNIGNKVLYVTIHGNTKHKLLKLILS